MLNIPLVATSLLTVAVCGVAAGFLSGRADAHSRYLVSIERVLTVLSIQENSLRWFNVTLPME